MLKEKIAQMDAKFLTSGKHKISLDKFLELWSKGEAIMLDVRLKEESELVPFRFGINIPLHQLPQNLDKIPKDKTVAIVCHGKVRASIAYAYLLSEGFENVKILDANAGDIADKVTPGLVKKLNLIQS